MSHTKGPWIKIGQLSIQLGKQRLEVPYDCVDAGDDGCIEQALANANLIAAAPEMLEALENVKRYLGRSGEAYLLDSFGVNQAIDKARGDL